MKLKTLDQEMSVCKVVSISDIDLNGKFFFIGKTDEEISLVCLTSDVPDNTTDRVDGWRTFRIEGVLDFSLIGILSEISKVLAENKIGIFVVSTYNTDYILVKKENLQKAQQVLKGCRLRCSLENRPFDICKAGLKQPAIRPLDPWSVTSEKPDIYFFSADSKKPQKIEQIHSNL